MRTTLSKTFPTFAMLGLSAAIGSVTLPAFANSAEEHSHKAAAVAQAHQQAAEHTQALIALQKRWNQSQGSARSTALQQLVAKAEERKAFLLELMQTNPAEALRVVIPEEKQLGMPDAVIAKLESRIEVAGEIERYYEDYADGSHVLKTFLVSSFGERFELHQSNAKAELFQGTKVKAAGWLFGNDTDGDTSGDLLVGDQLETLSQLADGTTAAAGDVVPALTNTLGEQRTLLMLLNFSDDKSQPWSVAQAQSMLFGTVNNFIQENSAGRSWVTGDVSGWHTLSLSSTVCDSLSVRNQALDIANAQGIDINSYDRLMFAFPKNACGYTGSGTIGGSPSYTFINGSMILRTVAHELGHNLGLFHAHSLECGTETEGSSCTEYAYGDTLDIMGYYNRVGHFNGFAKEQLGWLSQKELVTASSGGQYQLAPYVSGSEQPKVLKVLKSADSINGDSWYYLEMRQPEGEDAQLFDGTKVDVNNVTQGIIVHTAVQGSGDTGNLLDMTPGSASFGYDDWEDPALVSGSSFTSLDGKVALSADWVDANSATVSLSLNGSGGSGTTSCTLSAPSISVSGGSSLWGYAGEMLSYTLNVANPNGSECGTLQVNLGAQVPSGWSAGFSKSTLSLAAGSSSSLTVNVTSATDAAPAFYDIEVNATESSSGKSGSTTLTYVVEEETTIQPTEPTDTNTAPVASDDAATLSSTTSITIPVLANDSDADGDTLRIAAVGSPAKGTVRVNSDGTLTYTPAKSFKSSDSFSYTISDGKATATASVNLSLSGSTDSGSGGGKGNGKNR
ncbi:cadherin-like domain-containing protein [Marinobacterium sp. D7]|uniref:Ig-like domain-containing protein n=1 Tax=Marinobacterium ramblicola TaxID=2849041 RepID=UPI001C2D7F9C|nr:Ig-like domain-containing protein [Marinobacterium ramblicola]MBV1787970.1 cadherin-like domain-containing protein [Marinobacterium ramblicola]